jgi:HAD superfamily hydrolase (TIGR01509 family)
MTNFDATKIKAVFFDNDGILVDTEHLYYEATRQILLEVELDLSPEQFRQLFLIEATGAFHLAEPRHKASDLRQKRDLLYKDMLRNRNTLIQGVPEVLEYLSQKYQLAIASSCHREHFELIHARTNILSYFNPVLVREDVVNSKPDPEPWNKLLEHFKLSPDEALVIEDSPRGLLAAQAAGIECWVIPRGFTVGMDFSGASRVLSDIREIMEKGAL